MADKLDQLLRDMQAATTEAERLAVFHRADAETQAAFTASTDEALQARLQQPPPPKRSLLEMLGPTAARVVPAVGGTALGALGGPLGMAAGGAAGSAAGEALAEWLERGEINPWQVGVQGAVGAIPLKGVGFLRGAKQGALLGGASQAGSNWAEGQPLLEDVLTAAGVGAGLGGPAGALARLLTGKASSAAPRAAGASSAAALPPAAPSVPEALQQALARSEGQSGAQAVPKPQWLPGAPGRMFPSPPVEGMRMPSLLERMATADKAVAKQAVPAAVTPSAGGLAEKAMTGEVTPLGAAPVQPSAAILPSGAKPRAAAGQVAVYSRLRRLGLTSEEAEKRTKELAYPLEVGGKPTKELLAEGRAVQVKKQANIPTPEDAEVALDLMKIEYEQAKAVNAPSAVQRRLGAQLSGAGRDVAAEVRQKATRLPSDAGVIAPALVYQVAKMGLGGLVGGAIGPELTPEHPDWGRLYGAGAGALLLGSPRTATNIYIANLIGQPRTQTRNILSTAANMLLEVVDTPFAAGVERVLGRPQTASLAEVGPRATALLGGLTSGWDDFMRTLRTGVLPKEFLVEVKGKTGTVSTDDLDLTRFELPGGLANPLNTMTRLLTAADVWLYRAAKMEATAGLAYTKLKGQGLKGDALWQAHAKLMTAPDEALNNDASKAALRMIFKDEPSKVAQFVMRLREEHPTVSFLIPFARTLDSIWRQGMERSGLGVLGRGASLLRGEALPEGAEGARKLAREALGAATAFPLAMLAMSGRISGVGPTNEADRERLRSEGWTPYSIRLPLTQQAADSLGVKRSPVGEGWVPYSWVGPIAIPMAMTASAFEAYREGKIDDLGLMEQASGIVAAMGKAALSQNFLQDAFLLGSSVTNRRELANTLEQTMANLVPGAGLARTYQSTKGDRTVRNVRSFEDELRMLFAPEEVAPKMGLFGQPRQRPMSTSPLMNVLSPALPSAVTPDPRFAIFDKAGVRSPGLPDPGLTLQGQKLDLTSMEQAQVQQVRGQALGDLLTRGLPSLERTSPKVLEERWGKAGTQRREASEQAERRLKPFARRKLKEQLQRGLNPAQ